MAATKDHDPSTSHPSTPPYPPALCRVAVAQICLTAGYTGAESAALRALTDIAARYIALLAGDAASAAHSRGRTQSNIFDLALALERAACGRGYAGAADLARPPLRSSVLHELRAFVAGVDEIPFPRPIRRQMATDKNGWKRAPSFAQVGKEAPLRHVPRWLPCFPEGWGSGTDLGKVGEKMGEIAAVEEVRGRDMARERGRVRFRLGIGGEKGDGKRRKRSELGNGGS